MISNPQIQHGVSAIRTRLDEVRRHYENITKLEWLGLSAAIVLPTLCLTFAADNLVHLPMAARVALWLCIAGGIGHLAHRAGRAIRRGATDEQIALRVERAFPALDNELINSLLLSREAGDEASNLVAAVVHSGDQDSARVDLGQSVPKRRVKILGGIAGGTVLILAIYAVLLPDYFANACQRVLLPVLPVKPLTLTKIREISPQDANVLSGDDLRVGVAFDGVLPERSELAYKPGDGEWQIVVMSRNGSKRDEFGYLFRQVTRHTQYYVKARDARSDTFTINVHERPVLRDTAVHLEYPKYTGLGSADQQKLNIKALQGTEVTVTGRASKPLKSAELAISGGDPTPLDSSPDGRLTAKFTMSGDMTYEIRLTDTFGFESERIKYDAGILVDNPPTIDLLEPAEKVMAGEDDTVVFDFTAADDYGIRDVALLQIDEKKQTEREVLAWKPEVQNAKEFAQRYELPVKELQVPAGETAKVYLRATDCRDIAPGPGIGQSNIVSISIAAAQAVKKDDEEKLKTAAKGMAEIIQMQERNLRDTKALQYKEAPEAAYTIAAEPLKTLVGTQEAIRKLTFDVIAALKLDSPIRSMLESLYGAEMVAAVKQLRDVETDVKSLAEAAKTESEILARLTARKESMADTMNRKNMQDVFAELDAIIAEETAIKDATDARVKGGDWNAKAVAGRQDALADRTARFRQKLTDHAQEVARSDNALGEKFLAAAGQIDSRRVREDMIRAAAIIEREAAAEALPVEETIITNLVAIKGMLRDSVADRAEEKLKQMSEVIAKSVEKLDKLTKLQQKIKEISEEMEKSKDLSEDDNEKLKEKLEDMDEMQDKMAEIVEKMAKDLNIFPDMPVCNELVQQMREVYEDIEQKAGSESAPVDEIAVKRDESILSGLEAVKERMADMEMWLMDTPDAAAWKVENFDKDEIPQIPLVDLPEELEDLVGDLVDQEEELSEEANDSASNVTFGDIPAGWDTGEGAMESFGAKGKSGNERPNSNEQNGRSGGGREGASNGEMVEGTAKDLEGTTPKERRTNDPFQKGEVAEENPNSKARATGGGKQSGQGGEGALSGTSPARNELGMRELERKQTDIRRNTEKLYSRATLLYLPTGELDVAAMLMQKAQDAAKAGEAGEFRSLQNRIKHALQNTQRELKGEAKVQIDPMLKLPADMAAEIHNSNEEIPKEYEPIVSEYYKAIAGAATE